MRNYPAVNYGGDDGMSLLGNWLESMHVEVKIKALCSRNKNLHSTCEFCMKACTEEALSINQSLIQVNHQQCSSCGNCVIACPLSAIEGMIGSREFKDQTLIYNENFTPTIKELLIYTKRGIKNIQIGHVPMNDQWRMVFNSTNHLLEQLDEPPIQIVKKVKEDEKLSRRSLISTFQKEGKQFSKSLAPAKWRMAGQNWNLANHFKGYQFYTIMMNRDRCSLCQVCFSFCPQKVFHLEENCLLINQEKCAGCKACVDICPEGALEIQPEVKKKSEHVEALYSKICLTCRRTFISFHSETTECHVCKDRDLEWLSPYA
jgi:Fe-S-cluster-containing hydrogenase component 2